MYSTVSNNKTHSGEMSNNSSIALDPWDTSASDQSSDADNWLLGYVDILTLMLTLMVLLLAFNQIEQNRSQSVRNKMAPKTLQNKSPHKNQKTGPLNFSPIPKNTVATLFPKPNSKTLSLIKSSYSQVAKHSIQTQDSFQNEWFAYPKDQTFGNRQQPNAIDSLELSISPIDAINSEIVLPHTAPTVAGAKPSSEQKDTKSNNSVVSPHDPIELFRRVISEQKLQGLIDVSKARNAVRMEVNESILFETGNADLKPGGEKLLDELATVFHQQTGSIHIEGHTDNIPISTSRYPSNWELSASRASTVARNLIDREISSDRLRAIGFADTKPRSSNKTALGRSKNRRVSLVIEFDHSNS